MNAPADIPQLLIAFPVGKQRNVVAWDEMNTLLSFDQHTHRARCVSRQGNQVYALGEIVQVAFNRLDLREHIHP